MSKRWMCLIYAIITITFVAFWITYQDDWEMNGAKLRDVPHDKCHTVRLLVVKWTVSAIPKAHLELLRGRSKIEDTKVMEQRKEDDDLVIVSVKRRDNRLVKDFFDLINSMDQKETMFKDHPPVSDQNKRNKKKN